MRLCEMLSFEYDVATNLLARFHRRLECICPGHFAIARVQSRLHALVHAL